jgi:hypothetical protein
VSCVLLASDETVPVCPHRSDLVRVWPVARWIQGLLCELGAIRLPLALLSETERADLLVWLQAMLTPMLRRDERFHRLRREMRETLCFDPDLIRLALRTRESDDRNALTGLHLKLVWQHEAHLRVVEKDAPRLLHLAFELRKELAEAPAAEAVKGLKALLSGYGLTDAGWRYLLRHGDKPIRATSGGRLKVNELVLLTQALAMAGGHPPPSRALRAAWGPRFLAIESWGTEHPDSVLMWLKTEPRLAGAILKAANQAKRTPRYAQFIDDVTAVLWWLRDAKLAAPRKSLRRLVEAAKAWEADQLAIGQMSSRRWSRPRTIPCPDRIHEAVLLDSPAAVLEEARLMRNCLRSRLPVLMAHQAQLWSVRSVSGERVAVIELRQEEGRWRTAEIAARFNRPAPPWVNAFAASLAVCETLKVASRSGERQ